MGNDSEVCWALYICVVLNINIDVGIAKNIVENCGPLSVVALLHCAERSLVPNEIFDHSYQILSLETAAGPYWPVLLEWGSCRWPRYQSLSVNHELIEHMSARDVLVFDAHQLPFVFHDIEETEFSGVEKAIESRASVYEDDIEYAEDEFQQLDEPAF